MPKLCEIFRPWRIHFGEEAYYWLGGFAINVLTLRHFALAEVE